MMSHSNLMPVLPKFGWLPDIKYVQIQTSSRCNADCWFPLAGDELVITPTGNKPIKDLVGNCVLLAPDYGGRNRWFDATVKSFGIQALLSITFSSENVDGIITKIVRTDPRHRWILSSGQWRTTSALTPGDMVPYCRDSGKFASFVPWKVVEVADNAESSEVFCATIPDVGCFALAGGLLTGNCPYIESDHVKHPGTMTDETWHLILANLRPFSNGINAGKICPYLMQEPLIDKTIFAKIADIYRCFPKTCVEVSTNGMALTDKVITNLLASMQGKRHDIWVSHHGIDEESYQYIMQLDYKRATENLLNLIRASNGKYTIRIRGAGESADGKHCKFTRQQYLDYWQDMAKRHSLNMRNVHVDAFKFHDRAATLHRTDRDACSLNMGTVRKIDPQHPFNCPRLDQWLHFMWDGTIRLCCMDYHAEVKLPNINNVSLLDYFHGAEYTELISKASGRIESEENFICKRCTSPGG